MGLADEFCAKPVGVYGADLAQSMITVALSWAAMRFRTNVLPPGCYDSLQLAKPAGWERRCWGRKEILSLFEDGVGHGALYQCFMVRSHAGNR